MPHLTEDGRCSDCEWTPTPRWLEISSPSAREMLRYEWALHLEQHRLGVIRPVEPLPGAPVMVASAEAYLRLRQLRRSSR